MRKTCPEEYPMTLILNGKELATFQLTNSDLEDWATGYLYSEGIIDSPRDIEVLYILEGQGKICAEVKGNFDIDVFLNKQKYFTAGCGRGMTFFSMGDVKQFKKVHSHQVVSLSYLLKKQHEFARSSPMYLETGGMHGACIIDREGNIFVREDIGRHNAVDKIIGFALRNGMLPENLILLTTGRISYEMLSKAARFGIGMIGSRTAATKQAVQLAKFLHIEVIGYIRGRMMNIYTSCGRVLDDLSEKVAGGRSS